MRGAIRAAVSLRARARADTVSAASCVRQLQKMQQIAQTLKSENNTLKAPGGVAAELAKRDDTIQRLKQEAKAVIDKLKQKHAEELRNLQNENAVVLANAGSSNIGGDVVTNAHLAELNADLDSCRQKIADLEVNAEFTEADKAEACARADALQQQLATKDAELAGLSAQLQTLQAAGSSGAAEEELKTAQAAVTRLEGEKARAEAAAASAAQQILQLQEALEEARKVRAHGEQALADAKVEVEQGRAEAQALQAKAATLEAQLQQTQQELQQVKAAFDEKVPSGASGPSEVDDERPVEKANELRSDSEEALGKAQDAVAAAQAEMAAAVAEKAQAEAALEVAQQAAAAAAAEKVSVEEALQKAEQAAAAQNEELQVQLQQLQRDLQAAAAREGGIDAGGGSAEEVQALKTELQEASAARVAAEQQKQECEKTLKDELGKAKLDLQQARTDARELKNAKEAVETDLQDKNSKVEELNKRVEVIFEVTSCLGRATVCDASLNFFTCCLTYFAASCPLIVLSTVWPDHQERGEKNLGKDHETAGGCSGGEQPADRAAATVPAAGGSRGSDSAVARRGTN